MRHLINLFELSPLDVRSILDRAADLKSEWKQGRRPDVWSGRVLVQVFEKPSLRTRVSFESAAAQMGGSSVFLSFAETGLGSRETVQDVARVLGGYADVIALRTFSQQLIERFALHAGRPVINALSDDRHPCQALADLFTIEETLGSLTGRTLVYIGDGNNMARSLAIATAAVGMRLVVCCPPGYQLAHEFLHELKRRSPSAELDLSSDPGSSVQDADVIYTDVWASMGQESESDVRQREFAPFQVNAALMAKAPKDCRFMHCLPARRGQEVTDDVIDAPTSIVFLQAENRMHLAKGLLAWLVETP